MSKVNELFDLCHDSDDTSFDEDEIDGNADEDKINQGLRPWRGGRWLSDSRAWSSPCREGGIQHGNLAFERIKDDCKN